MKCFRLCLVVVVALTSGMAQAAMTHQWAFNEVGANAGKDYVGSCNATLNGAALVDSGQVWLDASTGTYVDLGGPCIGINTYSGFSLALWSTQYVDQGYTMTAALGGTWDNGWAGKKYVAISTARGDQVSRAMLTTGNNDGAPWTEEVGINGPELNDSTEHLYVLTVGPAPACISGCTDKPVITLYIDGVWQGMATMGNRVISDLETAKAYLGASMYPGDPLWAGGINEFDIFDTAITCDEVLAIYAAGPSNIPEPATMVLLGLGSLALIRRRKS